MGIFRAQLFIHIFQIRQIDIHKSFESFYRIHILITARIIHNRYAKSPVLCPPECPHNLWHKLPCRYKIDVVCLFFLQFQKDLRQPFFGDLFSHRSVRDVSVLAEYAVQRAAAKKDRT